MSSIKNMLANSGDTYNEFLRIQKRIEETLEKIRSGEIDINSKRIEFVDETEPDGMVDPELKELYVKFRKFTNHYITRLLQMQNDDNFDEDEESLIRGNMERIIGEMRAKLENPADNMFK